MAMNDDAVLLPATGYIYLADVGTAAPAYDDLTGVPDTAPGDEWTNIGHTSRDDLPAWNYDGGEPEVKGTWQNAAFRSVVLESATEYLTFNAHQLTRENLQFYFGRGAGGSDPNVFHASTTDGQNPERALLIVLLDGPRRAGFWAPRASLSRESEIELDSEEFITFPLRATFLTYTGMPFFDWISPNLGEPLESDGEPAGVSAQVSETV